MAETLKQQHENQLEEIKNEHLNVFDQQLQAETEAKLDSIKQQLALIEDIVQNHPDKKEEIRDTIKKAKEEIAGLKKDTQLSEPQKIALQEYEKKSTEIENSIAPWYTKTWDWTKEKLGGTVDYIKENPGKSLAIVGSLGIGYGLYKWFTRKKDEKDKQSEENKKDKKPRYKRWYTWAGVGVAGFLGWRYWGDIKGFFEGLFGGEKHKKDLLGEDLAKALGDDWSYDKVANTFSYKSKTYTWELFSDQKLIHMTVDKDGKPILDKEKTVAAIQEYVANDFKTPPDKKHLLNTDATQQKFESLPDEKKSAYKSVGEQINGFYTSWYKTDREALGSDSGYIVFHLDDHFGNIGTLLNQDTFPLLRDATTEDFIESIFNFFPQPFITAMLAAANGMNIIGLDQAAQDSSRLAKLIDGLKPNDKLKLRSFCIDLYTQWTAVSYYTLAVRDAYAKRVGGDEKKILEFEKQGLHSLNLSSATDPDVLYAIENPYRDADVTKRVEQWNKDEEKMLGKLDKAKNVEQQKKIIESLIGEIDDVGYHTWSAAFGLIWGHIWEKQAYLEYDVISDMYDQYMGDQKKELEALLKKPNLTSSDVQQIRQHIMDFYATMKQVSTQVELWQETDDDGNLITGWKIPIIRAGKLQYQVFMSHLDNEQWVLAGITLAAADLASYPLRKLIPHSGIRRFASLSPTVWSLKKLGIPVMKFGLGGVLQGGEILMRTPIRSINQLSNKVKFTRSLRFRTPESLFEAIQKSHITLDDAANMLTGKAGGKTFLGFSYEKLWGKQWRALGFGTDAAVNKLQLLRHNSWVKGQILLAGRSATAISDDLAVLAKHRDSKILINARRWQTSGPALEKLLTGLRQGTIAAGVESVARAASGVERVSGSVDDIAKTISQSQDEVTKLTKKIFADFDKELAEAANKKGLKKGTKAYKKLSESIRNSSNYGSNPKLQQALSQHNDLVAKTEKILLQQFNKSTLAQKQKLYANNEVIARIIDANGGIEKRKVPGFGRTGRMISVGVHAVMLGWIGSSENADGNEKDWGEIGMDATDFGLGMIPVAGGLYDIGMAFRGVDLNGREMGGRERGIRGGVGLVTGVLDVFTVGLGGTAIRAVVKGGTKVALKSGGKKVITESVEIASKGFTQGAAKQIAKSAGINILAGTTAGLVLIPIVDSFKQVPLDDESSKDGSEDIEH